MSGGVVSGGGGWTHQRVPGRRGVAVAAEVDRAHLEDVAAVLEARCTASGESHGANGSTSSDGMSPGASASLNSS